MKQTDVWTLAVVALFAVLLLPMINVAYEGTAEPATVDNESIVVDYNETVSVDEAPEAFQFNESVTARNSSGGELEAGTDYTWDAENGSVTWINTTATSDGEEASISYGYTVQSQTNENIAAILAPLSAPLGYLILIIGLGSTVYYAVGRGGGF